MTMRQTLVNKRIESVSGGFAKTNDGTSIKIANGYEGIAKKISERNNIVIDISSTCFDLDEYINSGCRRKEYTALINCAGVNNGEYDFFSNMHKVKFVDKWEVSCG